METGEGGGATRRCVTCDSISDVGRAILTCDSIRWSALNANALVESNFFRGGCPNGERFSYFLLHFQRDLVRLRWNVTCPFSNKEKLTELQMTKVLLV